MTVNRKSDTDYFFSDNITLDKLPLYEERYISEINVDGNMRRRLSDLGFTKGSIVIPLYKSPLGDPTAYKIMGSIIALRNDTASLITVAKKIRKSSEADYQ